MRFLLFFIIIPSVCFSGDCEVIDKICSDSECKYVNGQKICPSDLGIECWTYKYKYRCLEPNSVDYCSPLKSISSCYEVKSSCAEYDTEFNSGCMTYVKTWRCSDPVSVPSTIVRLEDVYTLVSNEYSRDSSSCPSLENNKNCQIAENRCIRSAPSVSIPSGINPSDVAPDGCYERQETYACISNPTEFITEGCDSLFSDNNCNEVGRECNQYINGQCVNETVKFECNVESASGSSAGSVLSCNGQIYCINGECADFTTPSDQDLAKMVSSLETLREAGKYLDPDTMTLFKGESRFCTKKLFVNCCKEGKGGGTPDGQSPFAEIGIGAAVETVKWLGSDYYDKLSEYTFDFLYDKGIFQDFAFERLNDVYTSQAISQTTGTPWQMSYYGITVTYTSSSGFVFGFNPTLLAIQVGIQVIMSQLSCEMSDVMTSSLNKTGLCHYIGDFCSAKTFWGWCYERDDSYCCYNSKFAKAINVQGRQQLGKSWGTSKSPDCSGFTIDEFQSIDFSKIDFSEVYGDIIPRDIEKFKDTMQNYVNDRVTEIKQQNQ